MFLSYLRKLNREEVVTYLKCMATVAAVDGDVHEKEREYFTTFMNILNLDDTVKVEILDYFNHPPELRSMLPKIKNPHLKMLILQDAYMMAYIDGDFHAKESRAIKDIIKLLEIKENQADRVAEWAKEGVEWHNRGEKLLQDSVFYERIY
jgi:tellurite resistance protein